MFEEVKKAIAEIRQADIQKPLLMLVEFFEDGVGPNTGITREQVEDMVEDEVTEQIDEAKDEVKADIKDGLSDAFNVNE